MDGDQNVPIEMWNVNKHRYGTNNTIEGWNSKLASIIGKQQPNVFSVGAQIKGSSVGILAAEVEGTWRIWSKTGKAFCETG